MSTAVITGGPQGGIANRLNIYVFVKKVYQFSLYVQALGGLL